MQQSQGGPVSVIRKVRRTSYTVVDNAVLNDRRLSWRATGLLAYLLSLPEGWKINAADLARRKRDGKDATGAAMRELEAAGYVERRQEHDERGHIRTVTIVYEEPVGFTLELADSPEPDSPEPVPPEPGSPGAGSRGGIVSNQSNQPEVTPGASSSVSSSSSHSTSRRRDAAADARFDDFWQVYPLRRDVGHARTAFRSACRRADPDTIIAGAARYRDDPSRDPEHTKYAQGWLNGDRWLDEAIDPQAAALRILQGGTG
jgi:hypothetical protein